MTTQKDLTKLKHVIAPTSLHLYYDTQEDGTNMLRHIRVNQRTFKVPADITVDGLPANSIGKEHIKEGGVGSSQIEDWGIKLEDLGQEVRDAMKVPVAPESEVRQIVTDYEETPAQNI